MIEDFIELLRELDDGSWVELEHDDEYICIDGHYSVEKIEEWFARLEAQVYENCFQSCSIANYLEENE